MLEFDSPTLANMTAALDHGCKMLSGDFDTEQSRRRIGSAIVSAAKSHRRSLIQLIEVAESEVGEIMRSPGNSRSKRFKLSWLVTKQPTV